MADTTQRLDAVVRQIEELGYGTPEYHEAMAFLFTILARSQWRRADSIYASRRDTEKRKAAAQRRRDTHAAP